MDRLTNPYQPSKRVGSPGSAHKRPILTIGSDNYVILSELESQSKYVPRGYGKLGGVLSHIAHSRRNSGSPDSRKTGGDGGIVVPLGKEWGKHPLQLNRVGRVLGCLYCQKRLLSGSGKHSKLQIELNEVIEKSRRGQKVSGLSDIMADPDFLVAC